MQRISIENLYEGLKYSDSIFVEEGIMFVPAKVPIRQTDLKKLSSLGVLTVYTDGYPISDEDSNEALAPQDDRKQRAPVSANDSAAPDGEGVQSQDNNLEIFRNLKNLIIQLNMIFKEIIALETNKSNIKTRTSLAVRQLWKITASLTQTVKEYRAESLSFILCGAMKGFDLAKSSINTAILSMLIAGEMGFKSEKITEITAAALLHDVGMLRLPAFIINKRGQLTPDEVGLIKSHTFLSYKIIHQELLYSDEVAVTALQHHERWNGGGYPNGIAGRAIIAAARIVCIADAFEAMVCEKPYRNSMIGYQAMKTLVSSSAAQFSPDILKAFVQIMGIYPIGSGVTLNDGRIARIVELSRDAPLRPTVKIVAEPGARKIKNGERVDLLKSKHLFITQPVDLKGF
jgi:HD-GYP domain-containing protein (c-di-GMP phosphodiesterase class II)